MDGLEELVGDPRDRDVGDLELLLAEQVQQQIQRAGERVELDDEAGPAPSAVVGASEAVILAEAHHRHHLVRGDEPARNSHHRVRRRQEERS